MKTRTDLLTAGASAAAMLVLILDAATALQGAKEAVQLCIMTLIPGLFPYFFLSALLTSAVAGRSHPWLAGPERLLGIPSGYGSLPVVGLLGGYPAGARAVAQAWKQGNLDPSDAKRLLGFCSNAGPAFIFGVLSTQFPNTALLWALWAIHILSALLTALLLSRNAAAPGTAVPAAVLSPAQALDAAIKTTANVCGWVILFRVLGAFLQRRFLWLLPKEAAVWITGLLELSSGCCRLEQIESVGLRFITAGTLLGLGGVCVLMQTVSAAGKLGLGNYLPGKLLQGIISFQLCCSFVRVFLPGDAAAALPRGLTAALWLLLPGIKICVAFPKRMVYNRIRM